MKFLLKLISITYFLLVFYITFLSRRRNSGVDYRNLVNFDMLDKIRAIRYFETMSFENKYAFLEDFFGNVLLFIPLIPAIIILFQKRINFWFALFFALFTSLLIESMQYIFNRGIFDVYDLVLNSIGGILGYFILKTLNPKNSFMKNKKP